MCCYTIGCLVWGERGGGGGGAGGGRGSEISVET